MVSSMDFSELTFRLLLLFFPGIICHIVVEWYTVHAERKPHQVFLHCFVLGMLSYCLYHVGSWIFRIPPLTSDILNFSDYSPQSGQGQEAAGQVDTHSKISGQEIFSVTCAGVVLGLIISFVHTKKWAHRIASKLKFTARFGELDVWEYVLSAPEIIWVVVRDQRNGIMYQGEIAAFSDSEEMRELFLRKVAVYNEKTGDHLYDTDQIYIARRKDDVTLEFQIV